ncbi:MAG: DUF4935 domain-containing protein [Deltaproteobacteria bacterium]|nr:DUF4935 domain-containing protein [Deltaproteobacteria bacterium]
MKKLFGHLLPLTDEQTEAIWKVGTLTVDANVLLDLYRYHPETRDALIQALRAFQGRLWLSHQAASEFVRNRARAAAAVGKELADADSDLSTLEAATKKASDALRGRRPLPREVGQKLKAEVEAAIRSAKAAVEEVRTRHVDGASTDAVLDDVMSLFDGCVGAAPIEAELAELHKEAQRRIMEKVPPGYQDAKKDGVNAHGDYLVWHQVLQQAKSSAKAMILVTSERKEDWWERAHGKTVGPRHELLEEAHRVAGQTVLIYQTDSFVERAARRTGTTVSAFVRNDIRAPRDDQELEDIITTAVEELANELVDLDSPINNLTAETNATDWHADDVVVTDFGPLDYASCSAPFTASLHYTGEQLEDRAWSGTEIRAELRGTIAFEDGSWVISDDYEVENAEIDYGEPDLDDDEPASPGRSGPTRRTST